jgi:hypothetical protein
MSDLIRLSSVAINCPDAAELAAFYADITGGKITFADPTWATVNGPGGRIDFQTVPDYSPPTWPESTSPPEMHLDFYVDDLAATEARVLAAGAAMPPALWRGSRPGCASRSTWKCSRPSCWRWSSGRYSRLGGRCNYTRRSPRGRRGSTVITGQHDSHLLTQHPRPG